jgi:hypothetical protein
MVLVPISLCYVILREATRNGDRADVFEEQRTTFIRPERRHFDGTRMSVYWQFSAYADDCCLVNLPMLS